MYRPRVIPVLLLKGKGLVKSVQFENHKYIGDPINAVHIFNSLEIDELVLLDILASAENRTISVDVVKQIGDEAYMPIAVGGGIKIVKDAINLIHAGAEKVVINSAFIKNPTFIKELSSEAGNQSVVVSIDVKKNWLGKYQAYSLNGKNKANHSPIELALIAEQMGAGEIIINSISHDGMMKGFDLELIEQITSSVSIPVVACGGAGNLIHLRQAIDNGAHAVAAGSMFVYHGARNGVLINYPEKKELINNFI